MKKRSKIARRTAKEVTTTVLGHTRNPIQIALRLPNDKQAHTPKENMTVIEPYNLICNN